MFNINIDKLKVCYVQPQGFYDHYAQFEGDQTFYYNDYELYLQPFTEGRSLNLTVFVGGHMLGTLSVNAVKDAVKDDETTTSLCWFTFENRALYDVLTTNVHTGQRYNLIGVWDMIADDLGLQFNNFTELEIALDSNFSLSAPTRKMIKDYQHYEMFVNGKRVDDPTSKIAGYHETFGRSRKRLLGTPTVYISQMRKDAPLLRMYHKSEEIKDKSNEKNYINAWNAFGKAETYRSEVRLKSNSIKEFLEVFLEEYTPPYEEMTPLEIIQTQDFLFSAWNYFTDKLIFFRDLNQKDIHLVDILLQ